MLGIKSTALLCESYKRLLAFVSAFLIFIVIILPSQVLAFKADTHVWVAQQVLNDLSDGQLTFYIDGRAVNIAVDFDVAAALALHPETYLMGSIGPDALPGIFSGHVAIHAGSTNGGWGSGEWFEYILGEAENAEENAFAYGMLGHAASDIFAHTYVNTYAGGIYGLTDSETVFETRHLMLESYISSKLPTVLDATGTPLKTPISLVEKGGELAIPYLFLQRTFINSDLAVEQFQHSSVSYFRVVNQQRATLTEMLKADGIIDEFENLINISTTFYIDDLALTEEELEELRGIAGAIQHSVSVDETQRIYTELRDFTTVALAESNETVDLALLEALMVSTALQKLQDEKSDLEAQIALASSKLAEQQEICNAGCNLSCPVVPVRSICTRLIFGISLPYYCTVYEEDPVCVNDRAVCQDIIAACPATLLALENVVEEKRALKDLALADIASDLSRFKTTLVAVVDSVEDVLSAERDATESFIELGRKYAIDDAPIQLAVSTWVENIDTTMAAYFRANAQVIINSQSGDDSLKPIDEWVSCHFPALLGIPSQGNTLDCASNDVVADIESAVIEVEEFVTSITSLSAEYARLKNELVEKLNNVVNDDVYQFVDVATGIEIKALVRQLAVVPTANELDAYFEKDDSQNGLLVFESGISKRINADMFLQNNAFDPGRYAVIANAITLSKLSLLKTAQLKELVRYTRFDDSILNDENIMFRFASNINGNHQWLEKPPPYLRRDGVPSVEADEQDDADKTGYGYLQGPQLWENIDLRNSLFRKLFIGPLVPGIEVVTANLSNKLPQDYPYQVIDDCSFPSRSDSLTEDVCPDIRYMDFDRDGLINQLDLDDDNDDVPDHRDQFPLDPTRSSLNAAGVSGTISLIDLVVMLTLLALLRKRKSICFYNRMM